MTRKLTRSSSVIRGTGPFIAVLTVIIALAALAQTNGASQAFGKSHAAPLPPNHGARSKRGGAGPLNPDAPLFFLPAVTYASGGELAAGISVADVNGDGKADLLVDNFHEIGVLLGKGDGTFQPAVFYDPGGLASEAVEVGDVNGDGKADLVVANRCIDNGCVTGSVVVLLGNGDGTFQAAVTYASGGAGSWSLAIGDVNGDGKPDVLVSNSSSNNVGVLLGKGDGTFQAALTYASGGSEDLSVALADVNLDGKPDLVVANLCGGGTCPGDGAVGVLLGNGDGTFRPAVSYSSGCCDSVSVAVADVNGDGQPDLLVANACSIVQFACTGPGTVGVLLGNGDGTFQAAETYGTGGHGASSVAVGDVNGDGKPDVVVANQDPSVSVLLGNGNGTFQPTLTFGTGGSNGFGAAHPQALVVADVNGDARPDLLVSNGFAVTVGVLLNNTGVHNPTSTSLTSGLNPSIYGQKVTWTARVTSSGSVTPTGRVRFTWSGYTIGSALLNSSGVATLTRSNLNADTYPLTAVYAGDAANLGSTSAVVSQVVLETTSTATLTSSPNPSTQGQVVTFTAKISSPTVIPTGPVTFTSGKIVLGTAQLSSGKAKLAISSLPAGSTKVTATYYGDSNIAKSSASVIQTVQ